MLHEAMTTKNGRVALVTGAAKGMGAEMALGLLEAGHTVCIVDRDPLALAHFDTVLRERDYSGRSLTLNADLRDTGSVDRVVNEVEVKYGRIDVLVNNAGVGQGSIRADNARNPIRFWEVTQEQWRDFLQINTTTAFLFSRALAPGMVERGWGRIVTITTSLDSMLRRSMLPYGPSKAASEAATAVMAADLAGTGVTANTLIPGGPTDTSFVPMESGYDRSKLMSPRIVVPPLLWVTSNEANAFTAKRIVAAYWNPARGGDEQDENACAPIAWTGYGPKMITPS